MFTVLNFSQTQKVMFTVLEPFRSSYKVKFGHLYSVILTILTEMQQNAHFSVFNLDFSKQKKIFVLMHQKRIVLCVTDGMVSRTSSMPNSALCYCSDKAKYFSLEFSSTLVPN